MNEGRDFLWHNHRSACILCGDNTGEANGRGKTRSAAGDIGSDGAADTGSTGPAAWIWDCATYRASERKPVAAESGHHLRFAGSPSATRLDFRGVGNVRQQPKSEVL